MLETFFATLSPMLYMLMCILIGFVCNKMHIVPENSATVLSKLENFFFVPALIINTFMKYCTVQSIKKQYTLILYCLIALAVALIISIPLSKVFEKKDEYQRNIYKYALTFGNFVFMGNAIVPQILGDSALYDYMLYILPLNIAIYTWGLVILIPKGKSEKSAWKNLFNPVFYGIIIGAFLGLTGGINYLPEFIKTTISACGNCMAPVAMILTGFVIGQYNFFSLIKNKKVYVASFLRLIVIPIILIGILYLLKADDTTLIMTLFAYATPLGINTVVFPAAYGGDTKTGASMAMISNVLSMVTLPLMFALLKAFLG